MTIFYHSTRSEEPFSPSACILEGLSEEGGLFVTDAVEDIRFDWRQFLGKGYQAIAKAVFSAFFTDFSPAQISYCVENAYNTRNFETEDIFTLANFEDFSCLELFRGRTIAFKDAALSALPHLMKCAKENCGETRRIAILTATSGDTGKAALEGFRNAEGIDVLVFYPYGGVSRLQLLQMLTQEGNNVSTTAVRGNFDDAQTAVKEIFNDKEFNEALNQQGVVLSSANSINIGRLIPQIVYYYHAYVKLVEKQIIPAGEPVNFVVPTGNFGNILAGYYAAKTGLPVGKLICSSNDNNVLTDFFQKGVYDKNRPFRKTISPSMDILISSNLERLLYEIEGKDTRAVQEKMAALSQKGVYEIDLNSPVLERFYGGYATEEEIRGAIRDCYEKHRYLMDTHTATGYKVLADYRRETGDTTHSVILSTASPFKFAKDVYQAVFPGTYESDVDYMYALQDKSGVPIPAVVDGIEKRPAKKETVIEKTELRDEIQRRIGREKNV